MSKSNSHFSHTVGRAAISIDGDIIATWRELAAVLGISIESMIERYLESLKDTDRASFLEDQVTDSVFFSYEDAEVIASRFNKLVDRFGYGRLVWKAVPMGIRWKVKLDEQEEEEN